MIDIQQGTLGTFEKNIVSLFTATVEQLDRIIHHRRNPLNQRKAVVQSLLKIYLFHPVVFVQHKIVIVHQSFQSGLELVLIQSLCKPNTASSNLVFVCGTDSTTCCTESLCIARLIQCHMGWQYQGTGSTDFQFVPHRDTSSLELGDFFPQRFKA